MQDGDDQASTLLGLPTELMLHCISYLPPLDLARASRTCRTLQKSAATDSLWQRHVNANLPTPLSSPAPLSSFRELYVAHHAYWFLPRQQIWISDSEPCGQLVVARYNPTKASIEAHAVVAERGEHTVSAWSENNQVLIHGFDPNVQLHLDRPILKLTTGGRRVSISQSTGVRTSFVLSRDLPGYLINEGSAVWPPLSIPAPSRARNLSGSDFSSISHRPSKHNEISQNTFRIRRWMEYANRRNSSNLAQFPGLDRLSVAPGLSFFASSASGYNLDRRGENVTTFGAIDPAAYTPTPRKPWRGIYCGDYSGHGCEFLLVLQPDEGTEDPLPEGLNWLNEWLTGDRPRTIDNQNDITAHIYSGRLVAIKLTGDPHVPRGQITFIAPDLGEKGLVRTAEEDIFRGARVVRSAGHVANRGFIHDADEYIPSQLILVSHDRLAQYWQGFGHISFYKRVDLDALMRS
ncbi:hypothetical protein BDZ85DRAFT_311688 [Elsinoe ampelina]|uniref:F-box domain-containing protein n=1 Tax=Elsinoe ampelina TaxID=302913 RepID=A0A6A6GDC5_9PEZI|nr:hypothetical protein BDZ85DRAFT_311688 [Elsinoe ampelina]